MAFSILTITNQKTDIATCIPIEHIAFMNFVEKTGMVHIYIASSSHTVSVDDQTKESYNHMLNVIANYWDQKLK